MARPLRLEHEHAVWHLTARGNEQREIFRDDRDRERFLLMLGETVARFGWRLFAWVLMSNHYHLLVQTPEPNLSRGMHWLNGRYAQAFNLRHKRCGHLFQGRFHGALVEKEAYLLTVARYVVLNPIRAGLLNNPADWRWSSYRQTAGIDPPAPWLASSDLLQSFGGANQGGCQEYVRFVGSADENSAPWNDLVGQIYLGTPAWRARIGERIASASRSPEHPRLQLQPGRPALHDILTVVARTFDLSVDLLRSGHATTSTARGVAAFLAFEDGLYRQTDIADAVGIRGRSTISGVVRRCRDALSTNVNFRQLIDACRSQLPRVANIADPPPPDRGQLHAKPWFHTRFPGS
jgi:putative transposase